MISTFYVGTKLDLKEISRKARNCEFNAKRFNGLVMRIREPRTTALIFSSGKIVVTGAKSEASSRIAARKFARIIQKLDCKPKFLDFKIQNIVATANTKMNINLRKMSESQENYRYEPERFPTLNYRREIKSKIGSNISTNGKLIITGSNKLNEVKEVFNHLLPILTQYKIT